MKLFLSLILFVASFLSARSQDFFANYIYGRTIPIRVEERYLDVLFDRTIDEQTQLQLNKCLSYMKDKKFNLASDSLTEVIDLNPKFWPAFYYRGICYQKQLKLNEAERDLLKASRLNPKSPEINLELARVYERKRKKTKAEELYQKSIELNPKLPNGYYALSFLKYADHKKKEAINLLKKCLKVDPNFQNARVGLAIMQFRPPAGNISSLRHLGKVLKADSAHAFAYLWRGLFHAADGKKEAAIYDLSQCLRFEPNNPFAWRMRGYLFLEMKKFDQAFVDLRKSVLVADLAQNELGVQVVVDRRQADLLFAANYLIQKEDGLTPETFSHVKKGYCLIVAGDNLEALKELDKVVLSDPSSSVFFLLAIANDNLRQHFEAYQYYDAALNLDKDLFVAYKKRCRYRMELMDWKGANHDLNEMFRIQPESPDAYRLRGIGHSILHEFDYAIADLTEFIKTDSSDIESLQIRADCYTVTGKHAAANNDLKRLVKADPTIKWYKKLADNYALLKDTASAIRVYKDFLEIDNQLPEARLALIEIYLAHREWEKVRAEVRAVRKMWEEDSWMNEQLSEALGMNGIGYYKIASYFEAITDLTQAYKLNPGNTRAIYFLAKSLQKRGEIKDALRFAKKIKDTGYIGAKDLYESLERLISPSYSGRQ